jgi:hypothetical protein
MSQFMVCKSIYDLAEHNCVKIAHCKENREFYFDVVKDWFGNVNDGIWVVPNIDIVFTQAQKQNGTHLFKMTKLYALLSMLFDVSEILILWYGSEYQDLDKISTRDQFLNYVEASIADPMCECYMYVLNNANHC